MRIVFQIARIQLVKLFCSPIAWLIFILLFIQGGYIFSNILESLEFRQRQYGQLSELTFRFFTRSIGPQKGVFSSLTNTLYLYLPLLTMGLISSELNSGTIKLLYSSPIKISQLVIGKYISMVVFALLITAFLWLFVFGGSFMFDNLDYSLVLSASVGFFLLSCSYMAIGLFVSSLSPYQIVVAVVTFVILTFLSFVEKLWQTVPYLNEIAFWLSLPTKANDFIDGLIKSQNLVYFLIIIFFFISVTILRISYQKNPSNRLKYLSLFGVFTIAMSMMAYISSIPKFRFYYDATHTKRETISRSSQKIIKEMSKAPLVMNVYANILDANVYSGLPKNRNSDKRKFEQYQRFKPNIEFNYIYFYDTISNNPAIFKENTGLNLDQLGEKTARALGLDFEEILSPEEIKELIDLSDEDNQYIRELKYNGKATFLRMFDGFRHFPTETQITAALKRLTKSGCTVTFTTGHGERSFVSNRDVDYRDAFTSRVKNNESLINIGFDFNEVSLIQDEIKQSTEVLVIADPRNNLEEVEIQKIGDYISQGRNLFLAIEADSSPSVNRILEQIGVKKTSAEIIQSHQGEYDDNFILGQFNESSHLLPNFWIDNGLIKYKTPITMPKTVGLYYESNSLNFLAHPFIEAESEELNTSDSIRDSSKIPTVLMLNRRINNKEQRIIVSGDADFVSNKEMSRKNVQNSNDYGMVPFMFHWLSNNEFPVNINKSNSIDNDLDVDQEEGKTVRLTKFLYMGIIPLLFLMLGSHILIKRRNK